MHLLPLVPSTQFRPELDARYSINKLIFGKGSKARVVACLTSEKCLASRAHFSFTASSTSSSICCYSVWYHELMQCYSGKGDVVKTNIYLPFSLHQSWHPALNSLPLPRYCGKATEQESSPSISCCWPKKQKGTETKNRQRT